jgi:hypothetical protein
MKKNWRRARLGSYVLGLGGAALVAACQALPEQADGTGAPLQTLADAVQTFVQDFARELFAAAVL